ncbi:MAG: hypothetical protein HY619_05830 [Thaumarchaeota archaeon]|nr:hypothetical protein [Nitrososphaerota archaeon]
MGKVGKGVTCSVSNCGNPATRSMSVQNLSSTSLKVNTEGRRAYLCDTHFKAWKKETKKSRETDRLRY